jgi:hypothetical protein
MWYGIPLYLLFFTMPLCISALYLWQKARKFNQNNTKTFGVITNIEEYGMNGLKVHIQYKDLLNKNHTHIIKDQNGVRRRDRRIKEYDAGAASAGFVPNMSLRKYINENMRNKDDDEKIILKLGDKLAVFYDPENPEKSYVGSPKSAYSTAYSLTAIGSLPILFDFIPSLF